MVVSTQQPDLTWMKSPRLAQLLEDATPQTQNGSDHLDHTPNHTHTHTPSHTPNHTPEEPKDADAADQDMSAEQETPLKLDNDSAKSEPETTPPRIFGLPRKRSSSLRDSMELEESGRGSKEEEEVMGLVLQEADSTTVEHTTAQPLATPLAPSQLTVKDVSEGEEPMESEANLGVEDAVKKVCSVEAAVSPRGGVADDESSVSSGGGGEEEGLEGGAPMETEQKKETYKEEATGQVESEMQGKILP